MSEWNTGIIEEFRENEGVVGGMYEGRTLLVLHTTGARTGEARVIPLVYRQEGDRRFIFASKAGADSHPHWYHNVRANGTVTVEAPGETYEARATELPEEQRAAVYGRQAAQWSNFADYEAKTSRVIPVFELLPA